MELLIHASDAEERSAGWEQKIAQIHGEFVREYMAALSCPQGQKRQLLADIGQRILESAGGEH